MLLRNLPPSWGLCWQFTEHFVNHLSHHFHFPEFLHWSCFWPVEHVLNRCFQMVKCRFWFRRSRVGWRFCICNKPLVEALLQFQRTHFEKQGLNIFFLIPQMSSCCFHTSKINSLGQSLSPTYLCKYCFIYFWYFIVAEKAVASEIFISFWLTFFFFFFLIWMWKGFVAVFYFWASNTSPWCV